MASAEIAEFAEIDQLRARLGALVRLRTDHGWTTAEEVEYMTLTRHEARYLAVRDAPAARG